MGKREIKADKANSQVVKKNIVLNLEDEDFTPFNFNLMKVKLLDN